MQTLLQSLIFISNKIKCQIYPQTANFLIPWRPHSSTKYFYAKLNVTNSCPVSGDQIINRIHTIFVCCKTHLKNKILTLRKDLICLKDISVEGFCDVCVQNRVKRGLMFVKKKLVWSGLRCKHRICSGSTTFCPIFPLFFLPLS